MNEFLLGAITSAIAMSLGQALMFIAQVIFYRYGSSAGSRTKDSVIAGQLPGPIPVPTPLPAPKPSVPVSAPTVPTTTVTGKMSTFGGPNDTGVSPSEGLALCEPSEMHMFPGIFLPVQPPRTTGLARRLDPSSYYIAMRWDYNQTPRSFLQKSQVQVSANGKALMARPVDWGPNADTGRVADLSPGLATALGLTTDNVVTVLMPLPNGAPSPAVAAAPTTSAEPAWLTWARGEIGFHETGDNQGIGKYITLSHCGAEGDPWCAIFANAALEVSGVPGTRSPAAQSFCNDPKFIKLDGFRLGAIVVFWRGQRSSGLGHVGFAISEDASRVQVLGGNENDSVMIEGMPKNGSTMGLLGYWWPVNATPEPKVT